MLCRRYLIGRQEDPLPEDHPRVEQLKVVIDRGIKAKWLLMYGFESAPPVMDEPLIAGKIGKLRPSACCEKPSCPVAW